MVIGTHKRIFVQACNEISHFEIMYAYIHASTAFYYKLLLTQVFKIRYRDKRNFFYFYLKILPLS